MVTRVDERQPTDGRVGWRRWQWGLAFPLIVSLPILAFAVATVANVADQQQRKLETQILDLARSSIERSDSLLRERTALLALISESVSDGDLGVFEAQTRRLLNASADWRQLVLRDAQGDVLAAYPEGASPDALPLPELSAVDEPAKDGVLARVHRRPDGGAELHLHRRLAGGGNRPSSVSAALDLMPFSRALANQPAPDSWIRAVLDTELVIAGRSRSQEEFVGATATPSLAREVAEASERFFYARNQEDERVYTAFSTSPVTGWTAAVGAPAALVEAPLRQTRWAWAGGGFVALVVASLLAWLFAQALFKKEAAERRAWRLEADRLSEVRLSEIAAHFPGVIYRRILHPDGTASYPYISPGIERIFGDDRHLGLLQGANALDELATTFLREEDQARWKEALLRSARELSTFDTEGRLSVDGTSEVWVRSMGNAWKDTNGDIVWDGVVMDITAIKRAERQLEMQTRALRKISAINATIASELDRDRLIQHVLDAGRELVDAQFGAFFYNVESADGNAYMLYALSGARPEDFSKFPMPRSTAVFAPTFHGEGIVRSDDITRDPRYGRNSPHAGMPEGHLPVRSYLAAPVVSRDGSVLGGLFYGHGEPGRFSEEAAEALGGVAAQAAVALDNAALFKAAERELAQRRDAEAHQRMLLNELDHRVKNSLAVVLAVANQTARNTNSFSEFNTVFSGRVQALAQAHTLLSAGSWQAASLDALVRDTLSLLLDMEDPRVSVSGPELALSPSQTLALSLVLHELATNASKYGALSSHEGSLAVEWAHTEADGVRLTWRERAPGHVEPPSRAGFGSRLIELNVTRQLKGTFERTFEVDGLRVDLRWPLEPANAEDEVEAG